MANNEVAHAGIGADITVNGLSDLIKANDTLSNLAKLSDQLRAKTASFKLDITGAEQLKSLSETVDKLNKNFDSNVSFRTNGQDQIRSVMDSVNNSVRNIKDSVRQVSDQAKQTSDMVKKIGDSFNTSTDDSKKLRESMRANTYSVRHFEQAFNGSMEKAEEDTSKPLKGLDKIREKLRGMHDTIAGSAIGVGIANGISNATSGAKDFIQQGVQLNQGGIATTNMWKQTGLPAGQIDAMSKEVAKIRGASDMAGASIIQMQKSFLSLTGSAPQARKLTDAVAAFGKESNASSDQISQSSQKLLRVLNANGKSGINKGMFDKLFANLPALRSQIEKVSGLGVSGFNKMLASGKLTGDKLKQYMLESANGSAKAWSNYGKTFNGMMDGIKGTWTNAKAVFAKPFVNEITKSLGSMNKNGKGMKTIQNDAMQLAKTLGQTVGNGVGKAIQFLTKNGKSLGSIVKSLFSITKLLVSGAWNTFSTVLSAITGHAGKAKKGLQGTSDALSSISKHTTAIKTLGGILISAFAVTKVIGFATGLVKIAKTLKMVTAAQWLFNAAMDANPIGLIAIAITGLVAGLVLLYKKFKPFREFVNGLGKGIKKVFGGIGSFIKGVINKIGGFFSNLYKGTASLTSKMAHDISYNSKKWSNEAVKWTQKMATDAVSITKKMSAKAIAVFKSLSKDTQKTQKDQNRTMKSYVKIFGDIFTGKFSSLKKDVPKLFSNMWATIKDIGKESFDFLNKMTGGRLEKMKDTFSIAFADISKVWHDSWNGIGNFFKGIWDWIKKIVSEGINSVIGVLNGGIGGIDDVISTFGGSKNAIHHIDEVHYATGTGIFSQQRRPITAPTLATLNDGFDSPETGNREMVLHANGASELIKGRNTKKLLEPGAEVLNASETKYILGNHFASGTGLFSNIWNGVKNTAGGIWDGAKNLAGSIGHEVSEMTKIMAHPIKFLSSLFRHPDGLKGIMNQFGAGLWNDTTNAAKNWWNELMSLANKEKDGGGGSSSLLKAVEKYGRGHRYSLGATGPNEFDCSGLVQYALDHAFGIHYPRTSGQQIDYAEHVPEGQQKPGDLIGNAGHIGVYAGHGQYWAAASPSSHPNIGMWPVSYFPDGPHKWGRVRGIKDTSNKSKVKDTGLSHLIKSETGGFLQWISKHMASAVGGAGNPVGDGVQKWIPLVKKAASQMGVSLGSNGMHAVLHRIQQESNGNPTVTNNWDSNAKAGNASVGLVQYTPTTMASWAVKGHDNIRNGFDQLLALFNDSNWLSDISVPGGWGPTGHKRRAKGGHVNRGETYLVGEEGAELFKPNEDGKIITHGESKRIMNHRNSSSIVYNPQINIEGDANEHTVTLMNRLLEQHGDKLMDMLEDEMGFNDDGGYLI